MGAILQRARACLVPEQDAIAALERAEEEREARRAARAGRGTIGVQPRCRGCNAFVRSISATCPACGWEPGMGWRG